MSNALEPLVAEIVRGVVAALAIELRALKADTGVYTSNNLAPDAPSKRRFNQLAPSVPGAYKLGHVWHVPVDEWRKYRSRPDQPRAVKPADTSVDAMVDLSLKNAKLRRPRG